MSRSEAEPAADIKIDKDGREVWFEQQGQIEK